ncbi:MAG: hypothetical protein Kow00127_14430 [Bacteroidales bacterium]
MFRLNLKEVLLIGSTTRLLFSEILKGVGRNPRGDGKKKGGDEKYNCSLMRFRRLAGSLKSTMLKYMTGTFSKAMI